METTVAGTTVAFIKQVNVMQLLYLMICTTKLIFLSLKN